MNSEKRSWQIWTIPNLLTFIRILLVGPIIYLIIQERALYFYLGLVLIVIAMLTDFLDGRLARKLNQVSEVGKILDPIADKLAITLLIIVLIMYKGLPVWVAAIIIGRDLLILVAGLIWASKYKFVTQSNLLGKWAAFFIGLMIIAYVIEKQTLALILTINAVFFTILSGIVYLIRYIQQIRDMEAADSSK